MGRKDRNRIDINKTCCFTGHRPNKLAGYSPQENKKLLWKIHAEIVDHIENKGVTTFVSGMALGIDIWSALIVLKLKETYPRTKLVCAIPCKEQWKKWRENDKKVWKSIIERADEVVYVSNEPYTPYCMQNRNLYMVERSDYVIAVHDGSKGGTYNCIESARKKGVEITKIDPNTFL